ncbi:hypothetical protein [Lamprobacter modestohalophilus]|uniref:hypothetical protein n=1 Tax=Lamprobacter modestohalophilus TaxID=1064514 RepID=UPI001904F5FC|nr:hypothetical protein [Lamprobacter modestohalophilus]
MLAVETAPRISDREIIETLTRLEAGQKALETSMNQRFAAMEANIDQRFAAMEANIDQRFAAMEKSIDQRFILVDQRFEAVNQRFEAVNQRFDAVDQRFNAVDQHFEALERRLDDLLATMLAMFSAVILLIVSLFGYIVWDRRYRSTSAGDASCSVGARLGA